MFRSLSTHNNTAPASVTPLIPKEFILPIAIGGGIILLLLLSLILYYICCGCSCNKNQEPTAVLNPDLHTSLLSNNTGTIYSGYKKSNIVSGSRSYLLSNNPIGQDDTSHWVANSRSPFEKRRCITLRNNINPISFLHQPTSYRTKETSQGISAKERHANGAM